MEILVTGATGFIGRHLCRALASAGHRIRALVRPGSTTAPLEVLGVERITGDVTVPSSLGPALEGVEAVVHLAGAVNVGRESTYDRVNREGTRNLAIACRQRPLRRFVFVSSLSAQGPSPPGRPHRAAADERPINAYGRSKLAAETALREELGDIPFTILRPTVVYGTGDPEMALWARLARAGLLPVVYGLELCFVHVDDLIGLIGAILERDDAPPGPFFVSDGEIHPMERLVDLVERLAEGPPAVRIPLPRRLLETAAPWARRVAGATGLGGLAARTLGELGASGWACTPDEATAALGFEPRHRLVDGLPPVFAWYRERGWI